MRIDLALVEMGLAPSRTKAQDLIRSGSVQVFNGVQWAAVESVSEEAAKWNLPSDPNRVRLMENEVLRFVSRGGLKLEGALEKLNLSIHDWICLDCGQSTGGFTDCLLQRGARKVVGFDVGRSQLSEKLSKNPQVLSIEELHIKDALQDQRIAEAKPAKGFDLVVADLSFVSIEKYFETFGHFGPRILVLVKPQFEVGPTRLNKKGLVKNAERFEEVEARIKASAASAGWSVQDYFSSGLPGRDGNLEFFLYAVKTEPSL